MSLVAVGLAVASSGPAQAAKPTSPANPAPASALRDVMFVGNNWAGTASIVDARSLQVLRSGVDLVPDKAQELADIHADPVRLGYYLAIQQGPGEGHDQYVDDMFTTSDGKYVAASRPSFGDVVWIDIGKAMAGRSDSIFREQSMDGYRTDHMALSPDNRRLLVSDSTARQVIEFSMVNETVGGRSIRVGDRLRTFESGETPHESNYSRDGQLIYHASIGKVYTPIDGSQRPTKIPQPQDSLKGDRWFQIVRNSDFGIEKRWDMGKELAESGYPNMSSAVRPMAVSPDGTKVYYQVSYFHGIVEFDFTKPDADPSSTYTSGGVPEPTTGAVTRVSELENRVPNMPPDQYVNDSAHHGLSLNTAGTRLCAAGTMDDYAALVDTATLKPVKYFDQSTTGHPYGKPYWTTGGLNDTCWVSLSDSDSVAVINFDTGQELAYLGVGDHPQRIRHGVVSEADLRRTTG